MPDGLSHEDAERLLRDAEEDLAAVRSWPPDRLNKIEWERAVYSRRESLKQVVRRKAPRGELAAV